MEYHDLANLFPLIDGDDFDNLVKDIAEYGQKEKIWLYEGKILDGRNRYRACVELGIEPKVEEYKGDSAFRFVLSLNLHRRHLSASQRGVIALEVLPHLEAEAKERQRASGRFAGKDNEGKPIVQVGARLRQPEQKSKEKKREKKSADKAAELVNVGSRYVQEAKKIKQETPELVEKIKAGELTIPQAKKEMKKKKREAKQENQAKQREAIAEKKANITLICGKAEDCPQIENNSIDLIITSPPYNFGSDFWPMGGQGTKPRESGIGYDDDMNYQLYFDWQIEVLKEMYRVTKDGGSLFYNHKVRQQDGGIIHPLSWLMRDDNQWTIRQEIVWDRKSTHNHTPSLFWQHDERIYWLTKGKPTIANTPIGLPTIWSEHGPTMGNEHPAPFTSKLPKMILKIFIRDGLRVLDPFVGSGTVIDVCYQAGIDSVGVDISEDYINKIKERYGL